MNNNTELNKFFDKIYCINLDRRVDRWEECKKLFNKYNLKVERFSAIDGSKNNFGLGYPYNSELAGAISHTKVIEKGKNSNLKNILIFEDDVELIDNFNNLFSKYIINLPNDWDGLLFGGNHAEGYQQISENFIKVNASYSLHAYAINKKFYDNVINYMNNKIQNVIDNGTQGIESVAADYFMADLHMSSNWYCIRPHLAWQRSGYSDIRESIMDYNFLKDNNDTDILK
jgi:GR25 family glycosyltransferase involved in LPS biosynthesis